MQDALTLKTAAFVADRLKLHSTEAMAMAAQLVQRKLVKIGPTGSVFVASETADQVAAIAPALVDVPDLTIRRGHLADVYHVLNARFLEY